MHCTINLKCSQDLSLLQSPQVYPWLSFLSSEIKSSLTLGEKHKIYITHTFITNAGQICSPSIARTSEAEWRSCKRNATYWLLLYSQQWTIEEESDETFNVVDHHKYFTSRKMATARITMNMINRHNQVQPPLVRLFKNANFLCTLCLEGQWKSH